MTSQAEPVINIYADGVLAFTGFISRAVERCEAAKRTGLTEAKLLRLMDLGGGKAIVEQPKLMRQWGDGTQQRSTAAPAQTYWAELRDTA